MKFIDLFSEETASDIFDTNPCNQRDYFLDLLDDVANLLETWQTNLTQIASDSTSNTRETLQNCITELTATITNRY